MTVGGAIILMQLIKITWGSNEIPVALSGAVHVAESIPLIGGIVLEKFRLVELVLGLGIYVLMLWIIDRTRIGMLIRAGVEDREMVDMQGYRIHLLLLRVFLFLLRLVNSPFGRVLQTIRENEFRAETLGYRTLIYRTAVVILSALVATLAEATFALINRYVNPENTFNLKLMVFILLMCVTGGKGTLCGAIVGDALFTLAQNYLQDLLKWVEGYTEGVPFVGGLTVPDHWLLWFGLLFVLSVYFFPAGVLGQLGTWTLHRAQRKSPPKNPEAVSDSRVV